MENLCGIGRTIQCSFIPFNVADASVSRLPVKKDPVASLLPYAPEGLCRDLIVW